MSVTESSSNHSNLENKSVKELLDAIHQEDQNVLPAIKKVIPQIEKLVKEVELRMVKGGRMFYVGAGTSGRLGVVDASEIPPTFGVEDKVIGLIAGGDGAIRKAVERAEDDETQAWKDLQNFKIGKNDTVVGIAASGKTPYVLGAVKEARKNAILTGCIVCNPYSKLASEVDIAMEVITGPEFITGSTRMKAGTAQKLILNMITTSLMVRLGRVKDNKMVNMQLTNNKLVERGTQMLMNELQVDAITAKRLLIKFGSVQKALENRST